MSHTGSSVLPPDLASTYPFKPQAGLLTNNSLDRNHALEASGVTQPRATSTGHDYCRLDIQGGQVTCSDSIQTRILTWHRTVLCLVLTREQRLGRLLPTKTAKRSTILRQTCTAAVLVLLLTLNSPPSSSRATLNCTGSTAVEMCP